MKNITKSIIALFAIMAFSCTPNDIQDRPVIVAKDAPVLTAPTVGTAYVLSPANAAATAERFTWNSANFAGAVEVVYSVQMDVKGGDFSAAQTLGSVIAGNQVAVTVEVMNGAALKLKAVPFKAADFDIRVVATTGTSTSIVSAVTAIVITPYTTESPKLWVPGGYQGASGYGSDWTPATAPQLSASGYGKTDFEGYVYINNATAQFKFTPAANWDDEYGEASGTDGLFSGVLKHKPASNAGLPTAKAAYYLIKADTDPTKLTYSLTETSWGIIGSATVGGWDNSTAMTYDKDKKVWTVVATLTGAEFKFRANNGWDINLGKLKTAPDGSHLEYGGDNIAVDAGNYTITLDLSTPRVYKYTITKN